MRATTLTLAALALALGVTGAQASLTPLVDRTIGTLTCVAKTDVGLVVGLATAADCTFVSDRDGAVQTYVALLPQAPKAAGAPTTSAPAARVPATMTWRVLTRNGVDRPGMLAGAFSDPAAWLIAPRRSAPAGLIGQVASLKPATSSIPGDAARTLPRIELAAVSSAPAL